MAKHTAEAKNNKALSFKQHMYDDIFQSILGLKEKAMAWWKKSLEATLVCNGCLDERPRKKNKDGVCAFCNGEGYVPDKDQRNMAFKEVVARLSPAPKSVEMKIDDNRDKEDLMKKYENMPKEEVERLMAQMDIRVKGEVELIASEDDGGSGEA